MKPSIKASLLMLAASVFMLAGVFSKPLGIPSDFESVPILIAIVLIYLGYRTGKKAKAAGQLPAVSESQKRKQLSLMVVSCAAMCVAMPFVMPLAGLRLPFAELVIISIVSFFLCLGAFWLGSRMKT